MEVKVATFDCYGTLIDWEGGAASFLYDARPPLRPQTRRPAASCASAGRSSSSSGSRSDYRAYRDMLADSLRAWAGERGLPPERRARRALARSMESWQPFPDTVPALRAAKEAGLRLWIISNTDRAIIDHSLRHLEVEFDGVTVAEDCPRLQALRRAVQARAARHRRRPGEILHVAFGFKYDLAPRSATGCAPPG